MISKYFFISLLLSFLISCGKNDKQEYVDNKEVRQETKQPEENRKDSASVKIDKVDTSSKKDKVEFQHDETPVATISPLEASDYMGKYVSVKGLVVDVYKSEKVAYLNFVEKYPNNPFSGVIFANKFEEFGNFEKYEGKNVEVTGRVSTFRGKPQMILDNESQVKILN